MRDCRSVSTTVYLRLLATICWGGKRSNVTTTTLRLALALPTGLRTFGQFVPGSGCSMCRTSLKRASIYRVTSGAARSSRLIPRS